MIKKANELKRQGRLDEAINEYRKYIDLNPNFSWGYHYLGEALIKKGKLDNALSEFRRAIEINPNQPSHYYSLGLVLVKQNKLDEAREFWKKCIAIDPNFSQAQKSLLNLDKNKNLEINNNILVSTSRSFMAINLDNGAYEIIDRGNGLYYGITYSDNQIYVAARRGEVGSEKERELEDGEIIVYDFNKQLLQRLKPSFSLRDMHQIQFYNFWLWICCTFDNKLAVYDGTTWHEWFPNPNINYDYNHFNSLTFEENDSNIYIYILAHNLHRNSEIWKFVYPKLSFGSFQVSDIKLIDKQDLGVQSHNIFLRESEVYTCSSGEGSIISNYNFSIKLGKFTRGLAVTDELIIVGISELSERKKRSFTTSYIVVLDRSWKFIKGIKMPEEGIITELRIPGVRDYCSSFYLGEKIKMFSDIDLPRWKMFDSLKEIQT